MMNRETTRKMLADNGGIAGVADFRSVGIGKMEIGAMCAEGFLERIYHGYYRLAEDNSISDEQLLAKLIPEGIICMESALFYYGYSDFTPRTWTIAVPRTVSKSKMKIDLFSFRPYYIPKEHHELGKTTAELNGVTLSIYDRDRTICDCFKYRTRLDSEMFSKAIHAYVADDQKNLRSLLRYAKELGQYKKVTELMEVMLNG